MKAYYVGYRRSLDPCHYTMIVVTDDFERWAKSKEGWFIDYVDELSFEYLSGKQLYCEFALYGGAE